MFVVILSMLRSLGVAFQPRRLLLLENLALRHQLLVLHRTAGKTRFRNADRLLERVAAKVKEVRILRLIGRYLRVGVVLPDGTREPTLRGVPQGGPLSPLLANIALTPLDRELERRGLRFADDFLILVRSPAAALGNFRAARRREKPVQTLTSLAARITKENLQSTPEGGLILVPFVTAEFRVPLAPNGANLKI